MRGDDGALAGGIGPATQLLPLIGRPVAVLRPDLEEGEKPILQVAAAEHTRSAAGHAGAERKLPRHAPDCPADEGAERRAFAPRPGLPAFVAAGAEVSTARKSGPWAFEFLSKHCRTSLNL